MKYLWALTSFHGSISRKSFWIGFGVVIVAFGLGRFALKRALGIETPGPDGTVVTLWTLLATIPLTALLVKRLNDRGRPNWIGYSVGAITALFIGSPAIGSFVGDINHSSLAESIIYWGTMPLRLFAFVEAGFLPGRASTGHHIDPPRG